MTCKRFRENEYIQSVEAYINTVDIVDLYWEQDEILGNVLVIWYN